MAEELKTVGYQCEFVGPVPKELMCKLCNLVAREPHIAGCCEGRFCKSCIDPMLNDNKPCPSCSEAVFSTLFTKIGQKKILALQVHCAMRQRGCGWLGQLEQLDTHLDPECQYVDVECPSKCDLQVQKRNLATHLKENCPKRDYMCPHCNYKATFEVVSNLHVPECSYYPVRCPNLCGVTCEREIMEDHMQLCFLEEVECELSYAGCKARFLRQDQDEHMQQNALQHMSLMAVATLKMRQEFEQKLQEKDHQIQELQEKVQVNDVEVKQELKKRDDHLKVQLDEKEQQIRELQESHKKLQQQLHEKDDEMIQELKKRDDELQLTQEEKDEQVRECAAGVMALKKQLQKTDKKLSKDINALHLAGGVPPYHLTMFNFAAAKEKDRCWFSDHFYTHPGGYKCYIEVWPNGRDEGKDTHVSVSFISVPGSFDDSLPWPAKATITLQLVNQHRDQHYWTVSERFEWKVFYEAAGSFNTFIPHAEMLIQYLKDDCLRFRISKIQLHK